MIVLRIIGIIFGMVSMVLMAIAFMPMLGWLNWINILIASIGMIFSSVGNSSGGKTMCGIAISVGTVRLIWGGGII